MSSCIYLLPVSLIVITLAPQPLACVVSPGFQPGQARCSGLVSGERGGQMAFQYGSRISLADQGNLDVAGESGAFVEPSGAGLVAAGPCVPVDDVPPGQGAGGEAGEQALDLRDGQRDHAGFRRWRLVG